MGPILDEHGLEQGGIPSSDLYKIYNNDLLNMLQRSGLGVHLGRGLTITSVGQADDIGLLSNDIYCLLNILYLTQNYCKAFNVNLCKTKLLHIATNGSNKFLPLNPIFMDGQEIPFSEKAVHVGVVRSTDGNLPHLLERIISHKKKLGAVMFTGIARSHRGNPAAAIKIEKLYGMPVLFSGVGSLVLNGFKINIINQHYKNTLTSLLKLHPGTPHPFIYFMSGSLPGKAILHHRQLSLFNMICHLPNDPLNTQAKQVLTCHLPSSKSWFFCKSEISASFMAFPTHFFFFRLHCQSQHSRSW